MTGLTLTDARTGRKAPLAGYGPLPVWLDLPARLRPRPGFEPEPAGFDSPLELRLYCLADLLARVAAGQGRAVVFVEQPAPDSLVIAPAGQPAQAGGWRLAVAAPLASEEIAPASVDLNEARYLALGAPRAAPLRWNSAALTAARAALTRLREYYQRLSTAESGQAGPDLAVWRGRFMAPLLDDLNTPLALAALWTMLQSDLPDRAKKELLVEFCERLGLETALGRPPAAYTLNRPAKKEARPELTSGERRGRDRPLPGRAGSPASGFEGSGRQPKRDNPAARLPSPPATQSPTGQRPRIIQSRDVRSNLAAPDRFDFTVSLIAYNNLPALRITAESLLGFITRSQRSVEVIVAEMNGQDGAAAYLAGLAATYANFRVVAARQFLGEAAGRNIALRQSRGRLVLLLDAGLKIKADIFEHLWAAIEPDRPALYGPYGLKAVSEDSKLSGFVPVEAALPVAAGPQRVDALDGACLCLPRRVVEEVGFMDESFRLPNSLDLDYSYNFRDKGLPVIALPALQAIIERPSGRERPDYGLPPEQRQRQRDKNWRNFLKSWQLD